MMEAVENGFREGTMKILILCDDKWHPAEVVERGLAFLAEEGHALDFVRDAKDILTPAFLGRYPVVINAKGNALTGANDAPWFEEGGRPGRRSCGSMWKRAADSFPFMRATVLRRRRIKPTRILWGTVLLSIRPDVRSG